MKVLWFEVTEPSRYRANGAPIGGWQDSLESIVRKHTDIELFVAFMSSKYTEVKVIDGVTYHPIYAKYSYFENHFRKHWDVYVEKMLPAAKLIVQKYKPDIIHIFGTEWPFGQISKFTQIPVVIHIQGAIIPYNNALYPPGYSIFDRIRQCGISLRKMINLYRTVTDEHNWAKWEKDTWKNVSNYMGRTEWDKSLSAVLHPGRKYYHVDEALRPDFLNSKKEWMDSDSTKIKLLSTGCSSFWKGPDMMIKVAKILKEAGVDFEWMVAGKMPKEIIEMVERKEQTTYKDNNIKFLGFVNSDSLSDLLCSVSMYVHTAYIENSPNSICEAQCLGVPIISTNVGGISTLVKNGSEGVLVPANDPWQMAYAIMNLAKDKTRKEGFSAAGKKKALERHSEEKIYEQLLSCYVDVIKYNAL